MHDRILELEMELVVVEEDSEEAKLKRIAAKYHRLNAKMDEILSRIQKRKAK